MSWDTIKDTLHDWAAAGTGLENVVFAYNNTGRPPDTFCLLTITGSQRMHQDDTWYEVGATEVTQHVAGQRVLMVRVQCYQTAQKSFGTDLALQALENLRCRWELQSTTDLLHAGNLAQNDAGELEDLSMLEQGQFHRRWAVTFTFNTTCELEDAAIPYIETTKPIDLQTS